MAHLGGLAQLTSLFVEDAQLTDAGLAVLEKLLNLEDLSIIRCQGVSDDGFRFLRGASRLKQLAVRDTPISGAGLASVKDAKGLKKLDLSETETDDEAMGHVPNSPPSSGSTSGTPA